MLLHKLIGYDSAHLRVDLRQIPSHLATLLLAVGWGLSDYIDWKQLVGRVGVAFIFLIVGRWTVCRLGASRLSSLFAAVLLIVFFWQNTAAMLVELTIFLIALLVTVEYFKAKSKSLAIGYGLALGVLGLALPDQKGLALILLCLGAVALRTVWHAVLERIPKIQLLLFGLKAVLIGVLALGVYWLGDPRITGDWAWRPYIAMPQITAGFIGLLTVLGIWGLWVTMLLATPRSPFARGMRMFFVTVSGLTIGMVWLLNRFGPQILQPQVMDRLGASGVGFTLYSPEILIFAVYTVLLLVTAGIDRCLFKDTAAARSVLRRLTADRSDATERS